MPTAVRASYSCVQRSLVKEGRWVVSGLCQSQLMFPNSPCAILWGKQAVPLVLKASTCAMALQKIVKQLGEGRRPFWTLTKPFGSSYTYTFLRPLNFFSQHLNVLNSLTQTFQGLINLCKSVLVGHFNRSVLHTSYPHPPKIKRTKQ